MSRPRPAIACQGLTQEIAAPQYVTHSAALCAQAGMPPWSSTAFLDGLGRAPLDALAAIFLPDESSSGEATSTKQGERKPS